MTNHLADELRGIAQDAADTEAHPVIAERLLKLVEHVEQVGDPATRADALVAAACLLAPKLSNMSLSDAGVNRANNFARLWVELADDGAAYIRTGQRPS